MRRASKTYQSFVQSHKIAVQISHMLVRRVQRSFPNQIIVLGTIIRSSPALVNLAALLHGSDEPDQKLLGCRLRGDVCRKGWIYPVTRPVPLYGSLDDGRRRGRG